MSQNSIGKQQGAAPCVATIGFFDGVHRGHKFLIKSVIDRAAEYGLQSAVITFDRHPRLVLHKEFQPRLLTTNDEKLRLLAATGVNRCEMLHFDEQTASLPAYDFMKTVLRERLNVHRLIIGYDNRFGHNRAEGFDDYVRYGQELGIEVERGGVRAQRGERKLVGGALIPVRRRDKDGLDVPGLQLYADRKGGGRTPRGAQDGLPDGEHRG